MSLTTIMKYLSFAMRNSFAQIVPKKRARAKYLRANTEKLN